MIFPLAIQLVFFIALCLALTHAQTLSERQFQEQQLISALDQVLLDRATTFGGILRRSIFPTAFPPDRQAQVKGRVARNLLRVRENPLLDATTRTKIDELAASYAAEDAEQTRIKNLSLFEKFRMLSASTTDLQNFHDRIAQKLNENELIYAGERHKIDILQLILLIGFFFDLCGAFASLLLFNRSLNVSLLALTANSKSVSGDSELPYSLEGSDELCTIDDALHVSHARLQQAKQQRQAINSMIAHDVRTPLMSIGLLIHTLSNELSKNANPLFEEVQRLERNIQTVHNHVEDLLVVEKLDAGKIELKLGEVNLKLLLQDMCDSFIDSAGQKNVFIRLQAQDCTVIGDSLRLGQVVQNYLSNAIRYSPTGGEVSVQLVVTSQVVSVRVKDSGPGIKLSDQGQLFSEFFQSSSAQNEKGFGLGLSICKKLIELHGGEVGVSSRPLAGSTFWFSLPVDDID